QPLAEGEGTLARRREANRELRYDAHWSDPTIAEWLVSAPGSMEHLLVLGSRPALPAGEAADLIMSAEMTLLPGAELWADGQVQREAFATVGHLEIRQPGEATTLILDPIVAYEMDRRAERVAGRYELRPAGSPGHWLVEVRTPATWWLAPERNYPAAIDPRVHVLQPDGAPGLGTAFVSSPTNAYESSGAIRLGPYLSHDEVTRGYVQFNTMPAMLTNNPMYIASAKLLVAPSGYWASNHRTCYDILANCSSLSAWTESFLFSTGFNKDIELQYLGSCPGNGCIVDLADTNFTMSFAASPENGNVIGGVRTLEVPPSSTDGEIQEPPDVQPDVYRPLNGDPVFWEWDVTSAIQGWYQELYDHGSTGAPTFMLRLDPTQLCPPGPYENEAETAAITCAALKIVAENIQLVIDYEPLLLNAAIDPVTSKNHLTNTMGVPSYNPGVFDSAQIVDQDLQTTGHLYRLQDNDSGQTQWRAIAVRGDHLVDPAPNSGVGLALWQYPTFAGDDPTRLQVALGDPADTQLLFIDEWQAVANSADLRAEVTAATEETPVNREARDTAANY
ncbi:MAG: hypothetical protein KDE59_10450, partial [Anaerolineales bacterium]|nr:hypothetical protein [Anaerolineales bacterium]